MENIRQVKDSPMLSIRKTQSEICIKCTVLKAMCGFHHFFPLRHFVVSFGNINNVLSMNYIVEVLAFHGTQFNASVYETLIEN